MVGNLRIFAFFVLILLFGNHFLSAEPDTVHADSSAVASGKKKAYVIDISGTVERAMAASIGRMTSEIAAEDSAIIIFRMDTFGGRVDAALEIVDTILNIKQPTVAYVKTKAISAGALIALAAQKVIMKQGTTLGDCAPIAVTSEGPEMMGEKFQSPLRAKFRTLAKRNGFSEALAESMVSVDNVVVACERADSVVYMDSTDFAALTETQKSECQQVRIAVKRGELLTVDAAEAYELGFSAATVTSFEQALEVMEDHFSVQELEPVFFELSWSEQFVRFLTSIAPLLMLIGFAGIYMEMQSPGIGLGGILGALALGLVFFGQYMVGLAEYTELLLLLIGIVLLAFEFFVIPGFGIAGIAGIVTMVVAMVLSLQGFVIPDPQMPWQGSLVMKNLLMVVSVAIGAIFLSIFGIRVLLPIVSRYVSGPILLSGSAQGSGVVVQVQQSGEKSDPQAADLSGLVGKRGTVYTMCRPSGKAKIQGVIYDVVSQGEVIAKGTTIEVLEVEGFRIVVGSVA